MSRVNQEETNPCLKEHFLSLKCLDKNNYDKSKCEYESENFKLCRSFWSHIQADRRKRNIKPYLPSPEEREQIKADYTKLYFTDGGPQ